MGKTREIKKRIKAVGNIRRITKTMQMIATSKFARAQQKALAAKPYTEGVFDLVRELASRAGGIDHPLIAGPAELQADAPDVVLVISSDRGLCGPYNGSILRTAMGHLRERGRDRLRLISVGKKGQGFFRFNSLNVDEALSFGDKPDPREINRLADRFMDEFIAGRIRGVTIVAMRYISAGKQRPEVTKLLPLKAPEGAGGETVGSVQYEFSPHKEELLDTLLPTAVRGTLVQIFNDAIVSEHVARMVAMKAATDNAGKMGKALTRKFNRARQAQITTELTEIISGAAALE